MGAMSKWFSDHIGFFQGLGLLVVSFFMASFIRRIASGRLKKAKVDPQVSLLLVRLLYLAVILLGIVLFVSFALGNPTLVFGGFGFFALAFSLAFQDILKNFIAGIFLLVERPFRIGDEITVDNQTGVVDNVEMRTTSLRTAEGEEVLIPNSLVYTGTIINRTRHPTRLFTLTAKVPVGMPLDGLAEKVREQLKNSPDVAKDPPPQVGVQPNIDGGVTLEVRYWLDYRKHDPTAVQATLGQQLYQAIQSAEPAPPTG
jgi:small conductance mechanosensitive channel